MDEKKFLTLDERRAYRSLEDVVGCKWSASVVSAIYQGVSRPGKLERYIPGISTKVLNERLRRLLDYKLITRQEFDENVPHVEYSLTESGKKLAGVIDQLRELQDQHSSALNADTGD